MKCDKLQRYTLDVDYEENVISVENDDGGYMDAYEVDEAIAELKAENESLKAKLDTVNELVKTSKDLYDHAIESLKATHDTEMMDAGMRERRLRRALYKACANWAHHRVFVRLNTNEKIWINMERKCLKKAEEYK